MEANNTYIGFGVVAGALTVASKYTAGGAAEAARNTLTITRGWVISDNGPV